MNKWFHRGLYAETVRRLRTPAVFMLVLATVFDAFPLVMRMVRMSYAGLLVGVTRFDLVHWSLYTVPFIVVPILMMVTFRYQHRRADSDFYYSLPLSKAALTVTQLAAVLTWTLIIVLGSSLVILMLWPVAPSVGLLAFPFWDMVLAIGRSLAACAMMASVFSLALSLCGTTVNTLLTASLLLVAPRVVLYVLNTVVLTMAPALMPQSTTAVIDAVMGNLLYGGDHNLTVWISTLVKTLLLGGLSVWAASRRPAEMAGRAAVRPVLHIAFRTLIGALLSLPAVAMIVTYGAFTFGIPKETATSLILFCYLVALVGYYLYELITTRRAKNLWKATLWLPLLAAVNLAMIGGCFLTAHTINHTVCSPSSVRGVELRAVALRMDVETMTRHRGYDYGNDTWFDALAVMSEFDKNPFYYRTQQYAQSAAPRTVIHSAESRRVVCEALGRSLDFLNGPKGLDDSKSLAYLREDARADGSENVFAVDVVLHDGWIARSRRIGMTAKELRVLLDDLKELEVLPDYFTNVIR